MSKIDNNTDIHPETKASRRRVNYLIQLDNRFWEKILEEHGKNSSSGFNFSQGLASLFERSYSSIVLQDEPWIDVTLRTLSTQFGWYRLRTKKFLEWCEQYGILEMRNSGKRTFARIKCMSIKKKDIMPDFASEPSSPPDPVISSLKIAEPQDGEKRHDSDSHNDNV